MKGRINLIKLTGLNNKEIILNAEHIEKLEAVPESLVTLINGNKYIVLESTDEIINRVIEYKNKIFRLGL
jgi:flagellar protein FlbD